MKAVRKAEHSGFAGTEGKAGPGRRRLSTAEEGVKMPTCDVEDFSVEGRPSPTPTPRWWRGAPGRGLEGGVLAIRAHVSG